MKTTKIKIGGLLVLLGLMMTACMEDSIQEQAAMTEMEEELALDQLDLFEDEIGHFLRMNPSDQNRLLASVRSATAKFHRIDVALGEGYFIDHCVEHPQLGGMGHHVIKMDNIVPFVNPTSPGVLLYEPGKNGQMNLIGVEYLVPAGPWDAGNDGPPMFGNVPFDDHREMTVNEDGDPVNAKGGPPFPHYQLHVWIWKNNPAGMYFPFNPTVSCAYAMGH